MLVECRSDTEYAERPVALHWQEHRLEILEILARWRTPAGKCFRVRTADDQIFELTYNETTAGWEIQQL
jgi:hypothetical protein